MWLAGLPSGHASRIYGKRAHICWWFLRRLAHRGQASGVFIRFCTWQCRSDRTRQRINAPSVVFSAALPALLAAAASEGINVMRNTPSILSMLQENVRAVRAILDKVDCIAIPSHPASAIIHVNVRSSSTVMPIAPMSPMSPMSPASPMSPLSPSTAKLSNPVSVRQRGAPHFDMEAEERLLQEVVEDTLAQGVMVTRAKRLHGQEMIEVRPSIRLAISAAMSRKDCEKAANVLKASCIKVLSKRR